MVVKDVDGFGALAGAPGEAAERAEDVPVLELGVRSSAGERSLAWEQLASFCESGLFRPFVRGQDVQPGAVVALADQDGHAG
jgi:hypothetical protein